MPRHRDDPADLPPVLMPYDTVQGPRFELTARGQTIRELTSLDLGVLRDEVAKHVGEGFAERFGVRVIDTSGPDGIDGGEPMTVRLPRVVAQTMLLETVHALSPRMDDAIHAKQVGLIQALAEALAEHPR